MKEITNRERLAIIETKVTNMQEDTTEIKYMVKEVCDRSNKNTTEIRGIKTVGTFITTIIGIIIAAVFKKL